MKVVEYRGVRGLVAAEVLSDTTDGYTTGTPFPLAGVAEISKSTDSTNEAHYYDNVAAVVISSTAADELTLSTSAIELDVLAKITGQLYDADKGMFVEQERQPKYFAIGYITKNTAGEEQFVWRLKGSFNIPNSDHATENNGTDANGQEVTFTGISTTYKFALNGKATKAITVDTSVNPQDEDTFFGSVQTPDTVLGVTITSVTVSPKTGTISESNPTKQLTATIAPASAQSTGVAWTSSDTTKATVSSAGLVTIASGATAGSVTITATSNADSSKSDTATITVE